MKEKVFKYNTKKIIGLLFICLIFFLIFGYGLLNATELSLNVPSDGYSRHRWVGYLAYKRPKLIFIVSLLFIVLSFIISVNLVYKLIRKTYSISIVQNKIYLDNNYFIDINNIKNTHIANFNYNAWLYLYLDDVPKFLNSLNSRFSRIKYRFLFLFNNNCVSINLSLFRGKSAENYKVIKKLINK